MDYRYSFHLKNCSGYFYTNPYWGERTTPSLCGRMDQACAYGNQPILMTFDGNGPSPRGADRIEVQPLEITQYFYSPIYQQELLVQSPCGFFSIFLPGALL